MSACGPSSGTGRSSGGPPARATVQGPPARTTVKPPDWISTTGDCKANWQQWKRQFNQYLQALGLDSEPGERKVALMLTIAGPTAVDAYSNMVFDRPGDEDKLKTVLHLMDVHFSTMKRKEVVERFQLRSRTQLPGETFDHFLSDLKVKVQRCNYGALTRSVLRDQIVCGVRDAALRERMLREPGLTLEAAVRMCRAADMLGTSPTASMSDVAAATVHVVTMPPPCGGGGVGGVGGPSRELCGACGGPRHQRANTCPVGGSTRWCAIFHRKNHNAKFFWSLMNRRNGATRDQHGQEAMTRKLPPYFYYNLNLQENCVSMTEDNNEDGGPQGSTAGGPENWVSSDSEYRDMDHMDTDAAAVSDTSALDDTQLYTSSLDTSALDDTQLYTSALDDTQLYTSALDTIALDDTQLYTSALETSALDDTQLYTSSLEP